MKTETTTNITNDNNVVKEKEHAARIMELEDTVEKLTDEIRTYKIIRRLLLGLIALLVCGAYALYINKYPVGSTTLGVLAFFSLVFIYALDTSAQKDEKKELENDIDFLTFNTPPKKAEQLFKNHQAELKKYYDAARMQNYYIFFVGVLCILFGFAVVVATIYLIDKPGNENGKTTITAIGAVSSFITNFIGVIFLRMYSQTVQSLTEFHNKLVVTHHMHLSNYLLSTIENQDLRHKKLGKLALRMIQFRPVGFIPHNPENNKNDGKKHVKPKEKQTEVKDVPSIVVNPEAN